MGTVEGTDDPRRTCHDADAERGFLADMMGSVQAFVAMDVDAFSLFIDPVQVARLDEVPIGEDNPLAGQVVGNAGDHSGCGISRRYLSARRFGQGLAWAGGQQQDPQGNDHETDPQ